MKHFPCTIFQMLILLQSFFRNRIISESCDTEDPDKTGSLKRQNSKTRMRDLALRHRISQE